MISADILNAVALSQDGNAESSVYMDQILNNNADKPQLSYQTFLEMSRIKMNSYILPTIPSKTFNSLYNLISTKDINNPNWRLAITSSAEYEQYINAIRFYGYTLLIKLITKYYNKLNVEIVKKDLEDFLISNDAVILEYNNFVCQKFSQYISSIALQNWPNKWNTFLKSFLSSIKTQSQILIFLYFISEISQQLNEDTNNMISYNNKIKIASVLKTEAEQILQKIQEASAINNNFIKSAWVQSLFYILPGELLWNYIQLLKSKLLDPLFSQYRLDILNTLYNMANNLDTRNEQIAPNNYSHLDSYIALIAEFSFESVNQSFFSYNITDDIPNLQMVIANTVKNLIEKNFPNILNHIQWTRIYSFFIQGILPLVSHPSIDISIIGMNTTCMFIRRLPPTKYKFSEEDISRIVATIYLRILRFGNPGVPIDKNLETSLNTFIKQLYFQLLNIKIEDWSKLISTHYNLDDTIVTGGDLGDNPAYSDFNTKFATLRSSGLTCITTLANSNPENVDTAIKTLLEIAKISFSYQFYEEISVLNQRTISWLVPKYIIYEGLSQIFESLVAARSATGNKKGLDWIPTAKIFYCEMININFDANSFKPIAFLLENRKLEFINNTATFLLHQTVPIEDVLEYLFSIVQTPVDGTFISSTQRHPRKTAASALVNICKVCTDLISTKIYLIIDKLAELLHNPNNDRFFISETLLNCISCLKNPNDRINFVELIISPKIEAFLSMSYLMSDSNTILQAIIGSPPSQYGKVGVGVVPEFKEMLKKGLTQLTTLLKRIDLYKINNIESIKKMLPVFIDFVIKFVDIWNPTNLERSDWEWKKPLLCPGIDEVESIQWFSSAVSASQIVNLLFPFGDFPKDFVISSRHDLFSIRSALFRLLGVCVPLYNDEAMEKFQSLISMSKCLPFSHQTLLLRHFILPFYSDDNFRVPLRLKNDLLENLNKSLFQSNMIDNEWLSLRHLKRYLENTTDTSGLEREKYLNLYYMRVHSSIEYCSLILQTICSITRWAKLGGSDQEYITYKKKILEQLGNPIIHILISSLLWPNVDIVLEGLRLIKQYIKTYSTLLDFIQDKSKFSFNVLEMCKAIINTTFVNRDFDPLYLGISDDTEVNTDFKHFFSLKNNTDGRSFVQSFSLAIYSTLEALIKFTNQKDLPPTIQVLQNILCSPTRPILALDELEDFIKLVNQHKSIQAKTMLRVNIKIALERERCMDPAESKELKNKLYSSLFDVKPPEYDCSITGEDSLLGESILSLLLE